MNVARLLIALCFFAAAPAAAEDMAAMHLAASAHAVRQLAEGRLDMAPITVPYGQALAEARRLARLEGRSFTPPGNLRVHRISGPAGSAPGLSYLTVGEPSEEARGVIHFLRSREAGAALADSPARR